MIFSSKLTQEQFFEHYFEKNFFFQKRDSIQGHYEFSDLDELLFHAGFQAGAVKLHNGSYIPEEMYTDTFIQIGIKKNRIKKDKVYSFLQEGATLILGRANNFCQKIDTLTSSIALFSQMQTIGNGYFALGGNGTFGAHWDTHDVFAVQIMGKKRWQIYRPTFDLPLSSQNSVNCKDECPDDPVFDEILEEGDFLYIPRGWWHRALPIENEFTFHVAVGCYPALNGSYISWIMNDVMPSSLDYRRSLISNKFHRSLGHVVEELKTQILNPENFDRFLGILKNQEKKNSCFNLQQVLDVNANFKLDDRFRINSNFHIETHHKMVINGSEFLLSDANASIVNFVASSPYCTFEQIDKFYNDENRDLLIRLKKLVAQDVIECIAE